MAIYGKTFERKTWGFWISLVLILMGFVLVDGKSFNPLSALLVTLPTGYLILTRDISKKNFLEHPLILAIGKRSYSWYLFHYPLIAMCDFFSFGTFERALTLIPALGVAEINYRFWETQVRYSEIIFTQAFRKYFLFPLLGFSLVVLSVSQTNGWTFRFKEDTLALQSPHPAKENRFGIIEPDQYLHFEGDGAPHVLLTGDSHAGHFQSFFQVLAKHYKFNLSILASGNCSPGILKLEHYPKLDEANLAKCRKIFNLIKSHKGFDLILMAAYYQDKINDPNYKSALESFSQEFKDSGINLLGVTQVPSMDGMYPYYWKTFFSRFNIDQSLMPKLSIDPEYQETRIDFNQFMKQSDLPVLDLYPLFFEEGKFVYETDEHQVMYRDRNHINYIGARYLAKKFLSSDEFVEFRKEFEGLIKRKAAAHTK